MHTAMSGRPDHFDDITDAAGMSDFSAKSSRSSASGVAVATGDAYMDMAPYGSKAAKFDENAVAELASYCNQRWRDSDAVRGAPLPADLAEYVDMKTPTDEGYLAMKIGRQNGMFNKSL